jgi:hypothetical protein
MNDIKEKIFSFPSSYFVTFVINFFIKNKIKADGKHPSAGLHNL